MTTFATTDFRTGTVQFNLTEIEEAIALDGEGLAPDQVEDIIETLLDCKFPFAVEDGETIDDAIVRAYETKFLPLLQGLWHTQRMSHPARCRGQRTEGIMSDQLADTPANRKAYNRGWRACEHGSETAVERADDRREPWAWYAGFYDCDNREPKFASFTTNEETP